jgi:hypothetical protein
MIRRLCNTINFMPNLVLKRQQQVVVWIPIYKEQLSLPELLSLHQTTTLLASTGSILAGKRRHREFLRRLSRAFLNSSVKTYPNPVFSIVSSYCNLLLSPKFYSDFGRAHVLLAQPDVWICSADLHKYLAYDYIAPPFYPYPHDGLLENARCIGVGVGGLSLRFAPALHAALSRGLCFYEKMALPRRLSSLNLYGKLSLWCRILSQQVINRFSLYPSASACLTALGCNEDWVIGIYCFNRLRVAPRAEAVRFAVDGYTGEHLQSMKPSLPFGLHGWYGSCQRLAECREVLLATLQPGWSSFLRQYGYDFREDSPQELFDVIAAQLQ